jgi:catalase
VRPGDRDHLVENIVAHASDGVSPEGQKRVVTYWTNVDPTLGAKVAAGLRGPDAAADARAA